MKTSFKRYALLSNKSIFRFIKAASIIGCCFSYFAMNAQEPYSVHRLGLNQGSFEHTVNIINTQDGRFHVLTLSKDFIGDNWKYLAYQLNNSWSPSFYQVIDGDSIGYNIGFYTSSFFDKEK